jgi:hypothetical protein
VKQGSPLILGPFGAKVVSVENADWCEKRRLVRGVAAASEVVVAAVSCEDWSLPSVARTGRYGSHCAARRCDRRQRRPLAVRPFRLVLPLLGVAYVKSWLLMLSDEVD